MDVVVHVVEFRYAVDVIVGRFVGSGAVAEIMDQPIAMEVALAHLCTTIFHRHISHGRSSTWW